MSWPRVWSADLRDARSVRGRRGLLAGAHRFRHHGPRHQLHVPDGPEVIKRVTGEDVNVANLGGPLIHNCRSGVAHFLAANEHAAISMAKLLLSYLPQNNTEDRPRSPLRSGRPHGRVLNSVVPANENEPYDMHLVIDAIFDRDSFLEVHSLLRPERRRRLRAAGRTGRGHRGQQPATCPARWTSTPATRFHASSGSATPTASR